MVGCQSANNCPNGLTCNSSQGLCEGSITLQEGLNGYAGTDDTHLMESDPNLVNGALDQFEWDADAPSGSGQTNYAVLRFQGIFGSGLDQIPALSTITSAILTLTVTDETNLSDPNGDVHLALVGFDESTASFDNYGGTPGVQAGEIGPKIANAPAVGPSCNQTQQPPCSEPRDVDVTSSVQTWSDDPNANFGWIIVPGSMVKLNMD